MTTGAVGLLEVGEEVALRIRDWARARGTHAGMVVEFWRRGGSKHARLEVRIVDTDCPAWVIEAATLDVRECLIGTWARMGEIPVAVRDAVVGGR